MAYLDNIAVFVRVVELGNLSAAGREALAGLRAAVLDAAEVAG